MKVRLMVLVMVFVVFSFQAAFAQIFANFEDPADTTMGFVKAEGWGDLSSFGRIEDPTARSAGVLAIGLDATLADRGVVQSWNRENQGATIAGLHMYLPADFPDSVLISIWGDDNVTGWSWQSTDYHGSDIPKETWWPVYYLLEQENIENPEAFNPFGENFLGTFGLHFFFGDLTDDESNWSGTVYVDDAAFYHEDTFANFEDPADTTMGFVKADGWGDLSSFGRIEDPTARSAGVLAIGLDVALADRGVFQSWNRENQDAKIAGFHMYLPADFPDDVLISIWGDDNVTGWSWQSTDYLGSDIPKETWWPVYYLLEQENIENPDAFNPFGENFLGTFGLHFFFGELTGDDANWSGTVYADDAAFYPTDPGPTSVKNSQAFLPETARLYANYPNPFNPTTTISYDLTMTEDVSLIVYNSSGQRIKSLVMGQKTKGHHQVFWDGTNDAGNTVTNGIYFFTLIAGEFKQTNKMIMVK